MRRTPPAHPGGDDQARDGEGGEHGGDDADAERDGKAAHRPGADIKQHRGGDEGGDIGVENGRERAAEAGVDRVDRRAAAAHFFADALVDQHVAVDRDADGQHDAGDAGQRQRAPSSDNTPKIIATLMATAILANRPNRP